MKSNIQALIIDDERSSHEVLNALLKEVSPHIRIRGNAYGVAEGYRMIREIQPDVVFLDVQMNDGTGFDLIRMIDNVLFKVIFTTAYDHFAIEALRTSAIDFLLKPLKMNELKNAVDRLSSISPADQDTGRIRESIITSRGDARIAVNSLQKIHYVPVKDIIYCKANGPYTEIHSRSGTYLMASKTLSYFEEELNGHQFFRIHRSFLVNLSEVLELHKLTNSVLMSDGTKIRISSGSRELFLKKMQAL